MRIALVPSSFSPHIGGIEEVTRQLARHLVLGGDEVEVWTHRHPDDLPQVETIDAVTVRRLAFPLPSAGRRSLASWPAAARRARRALRREVRRFEPDVIHVHGFSGNGVYATLAAATKGVPLVITLHGETCMDDHDIYARSVALRRGLRWGLGRAALVTGPSDFVLDDADRFGLPRRRARVIPNGVDLQQASPPVEVDVPFDRFVLAVGRLVCNKGFDLLVRAFADQLAGRNDVGLVIVGDGPEAGTIRTEAERLDLDDRLWLPGWMAREQVTSLMAQASVLALPSRLEPFGVVVLEAMAAGLPVVASTRGGVPGWTHDGVDILLADPEHAAHFGGAIGRVLDDPELAARLQSAALSHVDNFAWPTVVDSYRQAYRDALAA